VKVITSEVLVFGIASLIVILGYLGDLMFRRFHVPYFLFLLFVGILLGPTFGLVDRTFIIPLLQFFGSFTLIVVTFQSGLNVDLTSILGQSWRAFFQSSFYILVSIALITLASNFILRWDVAQALIFSSMIGGEITAAVVIPLALTLKLPNDVKTILTIETAVSTIYSIVLFYAFLEDWVHGGLNWFTAASSVINKFAVGLAVGAALSPILLKFIDCLEKRGYIPVLSIGLTLTTYSAAEWLGGNGAFAVLVFALILSNYGQHPLRRIPLLSRLNLVPLLERIKSFQDQIAFLLESFFFVSLGMVLAVAYEQLMSDIALGALFTAILLSVRYLAVNLSTRGASTSRYKLPLTVMCAQGLVPATLSVILLNYPVPLKEDFLHYVTYVIILTNLITTIGVGLLSRKGKLTG